MSLKDKIKVEFNPITGTFDLVSEFNADRILTHQLTPFGNPIQGFDPIQDEYYDAGAQIVTDEDGNVVVI